MVSGSASIKLSLLKFISSISRFVIRRASWKTWNLSERGIFIRYGFRLSFSLNTELCIFCHAQRIRTHSHDMMCRVLVHHEAPLVRIAGKAGITDASTSSQVAKRLLSAVKWITSHQHLHVVRFIICNWHSQSDSASCERSFCSLECVE